MLSLNLRNELWKLFGKKRTYIGFAVLLLAQNIILVLFRFGRASRVMERLLDGNGYDFQPFYSSLTFATGMAFPLAYFLIPIYTALVGGDLVAKEVEDGTLRMVLSRPITRVQLLVAKWLAGMVFAALLILSLGAFGLLFSSLWFPWGGMFAFVPGELFCVFDSSTGWWRYLGAHAIMVSKACTLISLGFMFSCFNVKPAAATALALSFVFACATVDNIPYFADLKPWLITHHLNVWVHVFEGRIPWWKVGESLSVLAGYSLTFLVVGCAVFQVRDFKA
jgi:ABC-2 type transport system permease protein